MHFNDLTYYTGLFDNIPIIDIRNTEIKIKKGKHISFEIDIMKNTLRDFIRECRKEEHKKVRFYGKNRTYILNLDTAFVSVFNLLEANKRYYEYNESSVKKITIKSDEIKEDDILNNKLNISRIIKMRDYFISRDIKLDWFEKDK
jgi:hypothetical protein